MKENQHYVEVLVDIPEIAECLRQLQSRLDYLSVDWQEREIAPYHITVAFMEEMGDAGKVIGALEGFSGGGGLLLDSYDVFTEYSGRHHVISLTSSEMPEDWLDNVTELRRGLNEAGCELNPDFRLHVTLGRVRAERIPLEELRELLSSLPKPDLWARMVCTRLMRRNRHRVLWDSCCQLGDENKFTYNSIRTLCYNNESRILAHENLAYILNNRKVRYINPMGYFEVTEFGNFWFDTGGAMYLITKDSRYTPYHKPGVLPFSLWSVVPIIFAGVSTEVKDDTGRVIFTGDIVTLDDHFTSLAHYLYWEDEPSLAGDNCDYMFSMARESLHVEGTAFCNMTAEMFEGFEIRHIHWYHSQFCPNGLRREEVIRMAKLAVSKPHFVDELKIIPRCAAAYINIEDALTGDYKLVDIASDGECEEFIAYAHNHPETKFILHDFKGVAAINVRQRKTYEEIKVLKPVVRYQIRNIILPEWIYFRLMDEST